MFSFATEFPIGRQNSIQEFASAIRVWILGSRYTTLSEDDWSESIWQQEWPIRKGDELIDSLILKSEEEQVAAIRWDNKDEKDILWAASVIFNRNQSDAWVRIEVSRQSELTVANLPDAKKPVVVEMLLSKLGGASDGMLRVSDTPHKLSDIDVEIAADMITGKANCRLPIVYVSAGFHDDHGVKCTSLASKLSGMAHVVVEPNLHFSRRLRIEVDSKNVYGGTVGIYWPDAAGRRSLSVGRDLESPEEVHDAVVDEVTKALANRRPLERITWFYVQELKSRQRIEELKASGSREVDEYIENFSSENIALKEQLAGAKRDIERLESAYRQLQEEVSGFDSHGLLRSGSEQDLYPGEIRSILRSALEHAKEKQVFPDSRREHVLSAILEANSFKDAPKSMAERLEKILKGARGIDNKTRRNLKEMGFEITEEGKHHKLVFRGDERYTYSFPKSSSDRRGGMNSAKDIGRSLF